MEPLAFIAAILGAGGLGVILKIVLGSANKSQSSFQIALKEQRASYQTFLENQRQEFEAFLADNLDISKDKLSEEHKDLRLLLIEQARIVRDGHRRMGDLLRTKDPKKVADALDQVMDELDEKNHGR
jgi:hypothetical protein